ncbi:MAG: IS200/IS605 family transposase [Muribaculaceae bacterium]
MSKVQNLIHIIFNTKNRKFTITNDNREDLYRFIWKLCSQSGCYLLRIGGIPNHIHILLDLSPLISLSDLVKKIKQQSSNWMKESSLFPEFEGWGREYGAFSVSLSHKDSVIEYIKSQQEHHKVVSFEDEYKQICRKNGFDISDYDFT